MTVFFAISMIHFLAANFAHPFTPTLIQNLGLHSYMFGLAFAAMSFTNFLFSPFWGKMRDYFSSKQLMLVGNVGYAVGQLLFSLAKTEGMILLARCVSGIFVGAVNVSMLVYVTDHAEDRGGESLAKLAILQSMGGAFGYLIGGVLGAISIPMTFYLQMFSLTLSGILSDLCLAEEEKRPGNGFEIKQLFRDANPLRAFLSSRAFMTKSFAVLFLVVLFANFGTNAFDQCFNYYIRDQFQFSSAYNGAIKAVIGVVTLIANSTICMWIMRRSRQKFAIALVLFCCAGSIAVMLWVQQLGLFIGVCMVYFAFNAIYIPLLQHGVARQVREKTNLVMGFYNATKSMGMIGGAMVAGLIYDTGAKLPFVFAALCFTIAGMLMLGTKASQAQSGGKGLKKIS